MQHFNEFIFSTQNGRYQELDELAEDLNLVFENAKQYNLEESKIYKVCCEEYLS